MPIRRSFRPCLHAASLEPKMLLSGDTPVAPNPPPLVMTPMDAIMLGPDEDPTETVMDRALLSLADTVVVNTVNFISMSAYTLVGGTQTPISNPAK